MRNLNLLLFPLILLAVSEASHAGLVATDAGPLLPEVAPQPLGDKAIDYARCKPYCITTVATESLVIFWLNDSTGKRVHTGSYRPDWTLDPGARPFPGDRRVESSVLLATTQSTKSTNICGIDGWGYSYGQQTLNVSLPGGGTMTHTYIGGGQATQVVESGGNAPEVDVIDIAATEGASNNDTCNRMRHTNRDPD